jgi:hypothetical protein
MQLINQPYDDDNVDAANGDVSKDKSKKLT